MAEKVGAEIPQKALTCHACCSSFSPGASRQADQLISNNAIISRILETMKVESMVPLWDHPSLHTDPRVQLLQVFENSIGNGGIPHPVRANSERKEILRSVICFTGFFMYLVHMCFVLFSFFLKLPFPFEYQSIKVFKLWYEVYYKKAVHCSIT